MSLYGSPGVFSCLFRLLAHRGKCVRYLGFILLSDGLPHAQGLEQSLILRMPVNDVQALMGHATPEITLKIYTHYCKKSREEEAFARAREAAATGA